MPGFWRKCRIALRCVRFTVWGLVLLGLGAFLWLNRIGLPGFVKTRLVTALHQDGVDLEFTRMRVRLFRGLVCDNVRIGAADEAGSPVLTAREVQLRLDYSALLHRHFQLDGFVLRQGKINLPLAGQESMALTNLAGELKIQPDDTWSLTQFRVDLAGATVSVAGEIAHAPECRNWKIFATSRTPDHGSVQSSLRDFANVLGQIHFQGKPVINARLDGDARDVHSFIFRLNGRVPAVQSPWCSVSNLEFAARITAPTNSPLYVNPGWELWTNLQPFRVNWLARGTGLKCPNVTADAVDCTGVWGDTQDVRDSTLTVNARARGVQTPWAAARTTDFAMHILAATNAPAHNDPAWGFWTNLQPFRVDWQGRGTLVRADRIQADLFECAGMWNTPGLVISNLAVRVHRSGDLKATAKLDMASRNLDFALDSSIDPHAVAPVLSEQAQNWLAKATWPRAPEVHGGGSLALPAWTNLTSGWHDHFLQRLRLHGELAVTNVQITGVDLPVSLRTHFNFSDLILQASGLEVAQGRTAFKLNGEASEATKNFHVLVDGRLDPACIRPFLTDSNAVRGFSHLQFREPVTLALNASGNLRNFGTLTATGRVAATNFAIRDQWVDSVTATVAYTNLFADFFNPQLVRAGGAEAFAAEKLTLDIKGEKLFLHQGIGQVLPTAVGAAIGPKTAEAMAPYQFLTLPKATVDGIIPLKQRNGDLVPDDADLHFTVIGTAPFRWRKFQTTGITGNIHWLGKYLILTNVVSECYGGTAHGWGVFDLLTPGDGTDFSFSMEGTNVDFNAMGRALWSPTNQLRGALAGTVTVTSANSSDWRTWNGYGEANLHNGLIWNAPIFGLMSPVLNTLTPGIDIGNSRATDGTGHFVMTNGVIFTDSLAVRSTAMRLDYVGTVDLDENVTARVKAQILRNTPVIGSLVSTVLMPVSKAFECEVTGTLDEPKITPVYLPFPRVLSAPLHPIRTVQQIFATPTNSPAKP